MAAGRPVVAYRRGGALESIEEGKTGIFFDEQTPASLAAALRGFSVTAFDPQAIRAWSEKFSVANFRKQITDFITSKKSGTENNDSGR